MKERTDERKGNRSANPIHSSRKCCVFVLLLAAAVSGCGKKESTALPDLSSMGEITVISREEGSGTRTEFENLVDTTEEGSDVEAESTSEVLSKTLEDENAIGYLASSALDEESTEGVRILTVDGVECTDETVGDGDYPLCREYLLCYTGDLNDLENDFISYTRSAGQAVASEYCVPIKDEEIFVSSLENSAKEGTITISGSSSMETLMEGLIEGYAQYNPYATIELEITDSTQGINAVLEGECDLAMSSRALESYEEELLEYKAIAADGIAVIVNEANPLTDISIDRLQKIYDGEVLVWSDLE